MPLGGREIKIFCVRDEQYNKLRLNFAIFSYQLSITPKFTSISQPHILFNLCTLPSY